MAMSSVSMVEPTAIVMEEFNIPSGDPGITLYVRNKHPADLKSFASDRTVLFVHGATTPAEASFDLQLDGISWMDFIARRGFDVYFVDVRGYGRSTRPPEMSEPPERNPPIVSTEVAVRDVGAAVDFIRKRRNLPRIELLGWSWGTIIMASYAAQHSDQVERVVLYAPPWFRSTPSLVQVSGPLGAYRTLTREQLLAGWMTEVPEDKKIDLIPAGWSDRYADACLATDPDGAKATPPVLRAPNGVLLDPFAIAGSADEPSYDPSRIKVPVLLIRADWDQETPSHMLEALFPLLVNARYKRAVTIGEGTHSVMMEKNRGQLFDEVQLFLEQTPLL
jgi:pimeloyl-ACP methyl ester carboxylesterase